VNKLFTWQILLPTRIATGPSLLGDLGDDGRQSSRLGVLFTAGDLTSAVGLLLAYVMIPLVGIKTLFLSSAGLFAIMFLVTLQ
jgi:hypothetical protein